MRLFQNSPRHPLNLLICEGVLRIATLINNCFVRLFQGLRSYRKRSLLVVNEHFENKRNAERTHKAIIKH